MIEACAKSAEDNKKNKQKKNPILKICGELSLIQMLQHLPNLEG